MGINKEPGLTLAFKERPTENAMSMRVENVNETIRFAIRNTIGEEHSYYMNLSDFQQLLASGKDFVVETMSNNQKE